MAQYVEVDQALGMPGLRVVLSPGVPGPWSEAAKGILHVKRIPYVKVRQDIGGENLPLKQWTAQTTAPAFVYNDERPRTIWNDQLYLCERLSPEPSLVPSNIDDRVLMFGLANELCGENGFGWARRLMLVHPTLSDANANPNAKKTADYIGNKYGYERHAAEAAPARITEILRLFARQLDSQQKRGSRFLVGDRLTAVDIYWAAFAALVEPLPENLCPMPQAYRRMYTCTDAAVRGAASPQLLAHRDFVYHEYLELPVDL
jgi:glutathione S-transferase